MSARTLRRPHHGAASGAQKRGQRGVVLFIALIVLVAMTLAAIATVRSVDTTNQIAGNFAFMQGATLSGDAGIEAARTWLLANTGALNANDTASPPRYFALQQEPPGGDWSQYDWTNSAVTLAVDGAGNTVSYVIHRMCLQAGAPGTSPPQSCASFSTTGSVAGQGMGAGKVQVQGVSQYYYRVTARIAGPRNTMSYVQSMIRM